MMTRYITLVIYKYILISVNDQTSNTTIQFPMSDNCMDRNNPFLNRFGNQKQ